MIVDDETASSELDGVPPPPTNEAKIPLQVNIAPQSRLSSMKASTQTESPNRQRPQNQTIVAVRICPLRSSEKIAGERCCIRATLTKPHPTFATASPRGNHKKRILLPSASIKTPSIGNQIRTPPCPPSENKKSQIDSEESSKELIARSLICDTENKMRFDFDHVIGPDMSQELCYHRTVGDTVQSNLTRGADTTIVVLGHKKSGKAYTMTGEWIANRKAREHSHTLHSDLSSKVGILPRAVDDLFEACDRLSSEFKATVTMSFYMVATEGGRTRDLLMRHRSKGSGEVRKGITFVQVQSPQGVKRLMDSITKKRVSDVKDGRKFHIFSSFRVVLACHDQVDCTKNVSGEAIISSTLTFISLRTPSKLKIGFPSKPDNRSYNLRDMLHGVSAHNCSNLYRRLDDVLLGVATTIIIGCVSPLESEIEPSTDLLQLMARVRKKTYSLKGETDICVKDDHSKNSLSRGCTELGPTSLSIPDPSGVLLCLQSMVHQADQAAKSAQESSESLEAAANRWRSHRLMLTRESTLAAIAQMKSLTVSKTEAKSSISLPSSSMKDGNRTPGGMIIKSGNKENSRQKRRHGPTLIREKEELKSKIEILKSETLRKDKLINSLQNELATVNKQLSEEREINRNLEDIRSILKRKAILQEKRLEVLEQKVAASLKFSACIKSGVRDSEKSHEKGTGDNISTAAENNPNVRLDDTDDLHQESTSIRTVKDNLLSIVDDSFEEASIYLAADDVVSLGSTHSTTSLLSIIDATGTNGGEMNLDTCESTNDLVSSSCGEVSIKASILGQPPICKCQKSLLASGYAEKIEFYLPRLNIACLCGKQQRLLPYFTELGRLDSILRPWQAAFLASLGIVETEEFLDMYSQQENKLPGLLMNWRATNHLEATQEQSCATALLIWSRSCSVALSKRKCQETSY